MQYRTFGRLDWKPSALGFGAMRLPTIDGDPGKIDEPEATRMIRYAIDHGVNYVDTAYPYHRETSEPFVGRALQQGYRERIRLATKMPCWKVEEAEDFDRYLDEQLERLQTDHVDFYLLHGLNAGSWPKVRDLGVLRWAEKAIADGRIHHLGFSFHDKHEVFKEIVDASDLWLFCQIQYNFMDIEYQAGTKGLNYAANKGLAVVVMEPLRGGLLTKNVPPVVQDIWDSAPRKRTPADWALQWVWGHQEVSVVLSGMSTMEQVEQNVASASESSLGTLTEEELGLIARVRDRYQELCRIPCTDCRYCLPCASGVNIPRVFEVYNDAMIYGDEQQAQMSYLWLDEEERANLCVECGECLEKCPQQIEIPDWLIKAHELLYQDEAA
ncbi:MAG: aldo/keto reductase [Chloroflexi bacterium B3_Chlor]|nr:MAG: aldo/keto reductase [Chloroflexi bacterium B3_Chlor]